LPGAGTASCRPRIEERGSPDETGADRVAGGLLEAEAAIQRVGAVIGSNAEAYLGATVGGLSAELRDARRPDAPTAETLEQGDVDEHDRRVAPIDAPLPGRFPVAKQDAVFGCGELERVTALLHTELHLDEPSDLLHIPAQTRELVASRVCEDIEKKRLIAGRDGSLIHRRAPRASLAMQSTQPGLCPPEDIEAPYSRNGRRARR